MNRRPWLFAATVLLAPPSLAQRPYRIRKGARPGDLPAEQPTRFELALARRRERSV